MLQKAGIQVPNGQVATTPHEAYDIAKSLRKFTYQIILIVTVIAKILCLYSLKVGKILIIKKLLNGF